MFLPSFFLLQIVEKWFVRSYCNGSVAIGLYRKGTVFWSVKSLMEHMIMILKTSGTNLENLFFKLRNFSFMKMGFVFSLILHIIACTPWTFANSCSLVSLFGFSYSWLSPSAKTPLHTARPERNITYEITLHSLALAGTYYSHHIMHTFFFICLLSFALMKVFFQRKWNFDHF